jgi:hypothetical protein
MKRANEMKKRKKTKKKLKYLSKHNLATLKLVVGSAVITAIILTIILNFGTFSP